MIIRLMNSVLMKVLRIYWHLSGGRRVIIGGISCRLVPETLLPIRKLPFLPEQSFHEDIVKYTDLVQMRSLLLYASRLSKRAYIADIGAYHGIYAVLLGKIIQPLGGQLIAVEPDRKSYAVLKKNIALNSLEDTVIPENVAIMDKKGKLKLRQLETGSHIDMTSTEGDCTVSVITMADLLKRHRIKRLDLLIIDVEGAELQVLKGYPWESVEVSRLFCELHPQNWITFGYGAQDLEKYMTDKGLSCTDMYFQSYGCFNEKGYIGPTMFVRNDNVIGKSTKSRKRR